MNMLKKLLAAALILLPVSTSRAAPAPGQFNQLWVFGDSLSDVGNVLTATANSSSFNPRPTTPYYDSGRFTMERPSPVMALSC